jgi:putative ABC transport system permease protein
LAELHQGLVTRIGPQNAQAVVMVETAVHTRADASGPAAPGVVAAYWTLGPLDQVRRLPLIDGSGTWPETAFPPALVVNPRAASQLGLEVGQAIYLSDVEDGSPKRFTVSGIVADGLDSASLYGALASAEAVGALPQAGFMARVLIRGSPAGQQSAEQVVEAAAGGAGVGIEAFHRLDRIEQIEQDLALIRTVFLGCGAITLLVSALGVLNIGLASVAERSRELVVRRAIGARRRDLFGQVLGNALALGVFSAAAATGVALAGVYLVIPGLIDAGSAVEAPAFPWAACAIGWGAALATALVGAWTPALKATRLSVASALRE